MGYGPSFAVISVCCIQKIEYVNPFKSEFTIVIHYKPRIAVELLSQFSTCSGWKWFDVV